MRSRVRAIQDTLDVCCNEQALKIPADYLHWDEYQSLWFLVDALVGVMSTTLPLREVYSQLAPC
jgi:hypothetical protein